MQDIPYTIQEYKQSALAIKTRIQELNAQINQTARQEGLTKRLLERRGILYTELCDIEYALRVLTEYQNAVSPQESILAVG